MDRKKLETKVEKNTFKFLTMIKESASDAVMLWINRTKLDVDLNLAQSIINQYKAAIESEYLAKVDILMKNLDKDLEEFAGEENPLPLSGESNPPKTKKEKKASTK